MDRVAPHPYRETDKREPFLEYDTGCSPAIVERADFCLSFLFGNYFAIIERFFCFLILKGYAE